jgi:hypothetical protein
MLKLIPLHSPKHVEMCLRQGTLASLPTCFPFRASTLVMNLKQGLGQLVTPNNNFIVKFVECN